MFPSTRRGREAPLAGIVSPRRTPIRGSVMMSFSAPDTSGPPQIPPLSARDSHLSSAPSSDGSSPLTPQYLVWLSYQQWLTETSPSRQFELFCWIKHLSSVAGLGSFEDLFLVYVRPARRCPTIAATTIQAEIRGFLCRRTPLQATTLGGNVIATPSYGDVPWFRFTRYRITKKGRRTSDMW